MNKDDLWEIEILKAVKNFDPQSLGGMVYCKYQGANVYKDTCSCCCCGDLESCSHRRGYQEDQEWML